MVGAGGLVNEIDSDDCVIVGDDDMWTLYLTLRATTGAAMYPEMEDPETQAAELAGQYDHVYYLGTASGTIPLSISSSRYTPIPLPRAQMKTTAIPADASSCSRCPIRKSAIRFPVCVLGRGTEHVLSGKHLCQYGILWVLSAGRNFCWSGSENASVQCDLQKRDYNMTVSLGGAVPLL